MNETLNQRLNGLQTRRSVAAHRLGEPGPTPAELDMMLTIASRVPDHGRLAPWRFIVIEGEARLRAGEAIGRAFRADNPAENDDRVATEARKLARAPMVVAVVSTAKPHVKIPEWEQVLSVGAVCMNLLHAAHALGYGASWLTDWFAFDRRVLDALGLEPSERMAGYIHIGAVMEPSAERARPSLADVVTRL